MRYLMISTIIPEILYSQYFWWIIAFVLIVAFYFARRKSPLPFRGVGKFFEKHKRGITKITDILLICMVLLLSYLSYFLLHTVRKDFSVQLELEPYRTMSLQSNRMFLFSLLVIWSGVSGFFVGLLSVFQSNITKIKRIILLIVCLLPILFTAIQMLTGYTESLWSTVQLCLYCSAGSWIINMPAVLVGKSFSEILGNIHKKVKLMFSHNAD